MGYGTDVSDELEFAKIRERELMAEIDRLKADLFEAKREYVQRQEWSAKQTEVVIKGLKEEIDELLDIAERALKAIDNPLIQNDLNNELAKHRKCE